MWEGGSALPHPPATGATVCGPPVIMLTLCEPVVCTPSAGTTPTDAGEAEGDDSLGKAARMVRAWRERWLRALTDSARLAALLVALLAALGRAGRQTRRKKQAGLWQLLGGQPASFL